MEYAEYILIGQMANINREMDLLSTGGMDAINKVPSFLKYDEKELGLVISDLQQKYNSLLKDIEVLRSQNYAQHLYLPYITPK